MNLTFAIATANDAAEIAALRTAASEKLTQQFGTGPWSAGSTERSVLRCLQRPEFERLLIARDGIAIVGTLQLQTKKPWAIDVAYFTPVPKALYLGGMAVHPDYQRAGVGREMLKEAERLARKWQPSITAIRLDAWDSVGGAGPFYAKCGYRETGRVVYRTNPLVYYELLI